MWRMRPDSLGISWGWWRKSGWLQGLTFRERVAQLRCENTVSTYISVDKVAVIETKKRVMTELAGRSEPDKLE